MPKAKVYKLQTLLKLGISIAKVKKNNNIHLEANVTVINQQ